MFSEMSGSIRWDVLCGVAAVIAGIVEEIREDLLYIAPGHGVSASTSGVAVDIIRDQNRWLFGITEAPAEFKWDLRSGARIRARKLSGTELWSLEFFGPEWSTHYRTVRDALTTSATELLPG
jgi:hypothetical protein